MLSVNWTPGWVEEDRPPSFVDLFDEGWRMDEFDNGISLYASLVSRYKVADIRSRWQDKPAMDVINLPMNEKDSTRDFSLAYVGTHSTNFSNQHPTHLFLASGDLGHVVRTINSLPSDYSGNLDILINDCTTAVICRNLVLLLILGTVPNEVLAVDMALHFWYSVFLPLEYQLRKGLVRSNFPLGPRSTLSCYLPEPGPEFRWMLLRYLESHLSIEDIRKEYDRVRNTPTRHANRERKYARLRPAHRVAFQKYRRSGILLPFGEVDARFNKPNYSLFEPDGKWWQTDYADPLMGWE
jgi:hypothetical protein